MLNALDRFLQSLDIPDACKLNKPVFKKFFLDKGMLDSTEKKYLKDEVNRIRWLYSLKPDTINIAPYIDSIVEYLEVQVLQIEIVNPNRMERIGNFIHQSIPYHLFLIFTAEVAGEENIAVSLAEKRISQANKLKWVVGDNMHSGWIKLSNTSRLETEFLSSLKISELPFTDFRCFYQALTQRVIAVSCARYSGEFTLDVNNDMEASDGRLRKLRELEKLYAEKVRVIRKLKQTTQMRRQVELNTSMKRLNNRMAEIRRSL